MTPERVQARAGQGWQLLLQLLHSVQSAAGTEPLDLGLIEGVVQEDGLLGPVGMLDDAFQGLHRRRQVWVKRLLGTQPPILLEEQQGRVLLWGLGSQQGNQVLGQI